MNAWRYQPHTPGSWYCSVIRIRPKPSGLLRSNSKQVVTWKLSGLPETGKAGWMVTGICPHKRAFKRPVTLIRKWRPGYVKPCSQTGGDLSEGAISGKARPFRILLKSNGVFFIFTFMFFLYSVVACLLLRRDKWRKSLKKNSCLIISTWQCDNWLIYSEIYPVCPDWMSSWYSELNNKFRGYFMAGYVYYSQIETQPFPV